MHGSRPLQCPVIAPGMAQSRAWAAPSSALSLHGQPQRPGTASVDLHGLGQAGVHLLKLTVERFAAPCGDVATTTLKCAFLQVVWEVSLSGRLRCAERGEALLHSLESRPGRLSAADAPHFLPADFKEDEEAGFMGLPFIQPEGDDEWVDNVPWEEVPEEAAL